MFKKTFILVLLLLIISLGVAYIFDMLFALFLMEPNINDIPLVWAIAALYVGRIYANIFKTDFPKNLKIKVILYYFFIVLISSLTLIAFVCDNLSLNLHQLKLFIPPMIVPFLLIILAAFCLYPALGLGCRLELKGLKKDDVSEKEK